ncbi:MAG: FAD:protein FMN transferase [Clostridiales bacterium]|nr:FAD:protein FMN transferase [Clostridiales bacterium]
MLSKLDSLTGGNDDDEYSQEFFAMDTYMTLTAYGDNAKDAVEAGQAEIERLDAAFSTGDEDSEVYAINAAGGGELSDEMAMLIKRSLEIWEETGGLFDISIYPVMELWGFTTGDYAVPEEEVLAGTLELVDAGRIILSEEDDATCLSMDEGMEIDLGGMVKGYADDRVSEIFEKYGVEKGIINLGGDVSVVGTRPDGTQWRVGIVDPNDTDSYLGGLALSDTSVVTSGGYERYFEDEDTGERYHHIIDPRTGYSAYNGLISVSVVGDDATLADALSTSLFIMGTYDAIAFCEEHCVADSFDVLMETEDGDIYITDGLEDSFIDLNGDTELNVIVTR